ncbi:MAG: hypothetical protein LQ340_001731 [Diploschistes diacapsis]|nr:MAG: hypothetical protein LQ340_001731 [Diploschistes diacapsis]
MDTVTKGQLIVVEGLDRAGKSTQVQLLLKNLAKEGHRVEHMRFPNRTTPIGKSIDSYLKGEAQSEDHVIHLLFSANRWEAAEAITKKLQSGITLVIDRYSYSGAVYSAAKLNPALGLEWAWSPEIGLPQPDIVLFLTVSAVVAAQRGGFGTERYETDHMQQRVREKFEELWRRLPTQYLVIINADQSLEQVEQDILRNVQPRLASLNPLPHSCDLERLSSLR